MLRCREIVSVDVEKMDVIGTTEMAVFSHFSGECKRMGPFTLGRPFLCHFGRRLECDPCFYGRGPFGEQDSEVRPVKLDPAILDVPNEAFAQGVQRDIELPAGDMLAFRR